MNYKVIPSEEFQKEAKGLSKKYKSFQKEIISRAEISIKQYKSGNFITQKQLEIESISW